MQKLINRWMKLKAKSPQVLPVTPLLLQMEPIPATQTETVKSFSKFDFVPGEKIIYTEDFAQDAIGELPLNWNSTGKGEVVSLEKQQGKWLKMFQNTTYLSGNNKVFDKNFTVEFDLLLPFKYYQHTFPLVHFGLLSTGDRPSTDNSLLRDLNRFLRPRNPAAPLQLRHHRRLADLCRRQRLLPRHCATRGKRPRFLRTVKPRGLPGAKNAVAHVGQ